MRPVTCIVEVTSGDWGIAGNPLHTADVHGLAAGVAGGALRQSHRDKVMLFGVGAARLGVAVRRATASVRRTSQRPRL